MSRAGEMSRGIDTWLSSSYTRPSEIIIESLPLARDPDGVWQDRRGETPMRVASVALIILGVALILFGVLDHFLQFTRIPYELYIFGVVGFILGAIGGTLGTLTGGVVPPPPDPEAETPMIIE